MAARDPEHDLALLQIGREGSECFSFLRVAGPEYKERYNIYRGTTAMLMGFGATLHRLRALPASLESAGLFLDLQWAGDRRHGADPYAVIYDFDGNALGGDSGSPVLDERGTVIGILIAMSVTGDRPRSFVTELPHNFHGGLKLR